MVEQNFWGILNLKSLSKLLWDSLAELSCFVFQIWNEFNTTVNYVWVGKRFWNKETLNSDIKIIGAAHHMAPYVH